MVHNSVPVVHCLFYPVYSGTFAVRYLNERKKQKNNNTPENEEAIPTASYSSEVPGPVDQLAHIDCLTSLTKGVMVLFISSAQALYG